MNYDRHKVEELTMYLYSKIQDDLKSVEQKKEGKKTYLEC